MLWYVVTHHDILIIDAPGCITLWHLAVPAGRATHRAEIQWARQGYIQQGTLAVAVSTAYHMVGITIAAAMLEVCQRTPGPHILVLSNRSW
jgi:hypothetical protein